MTLKLTARIQGHGAAGYLAYIDSIKGMAEMAETPHDAMKELMISLKVKMAYDLGIELDGLKESIIVPLEKYQIEEIDFDSNNYAEKEINLTTQLC